MRIDDASHPFLIRLTGVKVLLQQVFRHWQAMLTVTDWAEPPCALCTQP
jgi:hypothetical protein